ncbi:hypothetical protein EVA_13455 [gut metagenome]|uniref:Uncharacterized protein n=1 Tax=gut metagenome TaxID=749906 RepID=J9FVA2_9ZZZZ
MHSGYSSTIRKSSFNASPICFPGFMPISIRSVPVTASCFRLTHSLSSMISS